MSENDQLKLYKDQVIMKLLTREQSSNYLKDCGLSISKVTLARLAMTGEGPQYSLVGRTAYYKKEWLDEWIESNLTPSSHSFVHMTKKGEF